MRMPRLIIHADAALPAIANDRLDRDPQIVPERRSTFLPSIVKRPAPEIHGPQPPTSVTAAAPGSSTRPFAASRRRPTSNPALSLK